MIYRKSVLKMVHAPCGNYSTGGSTSAKRSQAKGAQQYTPGQRDKGSNGTGRYVDCQEVATAELIVN